MVEDIDLDILRIKISKNIIIHMIKPT